MLNIFRNFVLMKPAKSKNEIQLPSGYNEWRKKIEVMIETSKLNAALHVNADLLQLYWNIGNDIVLKQKEQGWGAQVISQLSKDLSARFPDDKGYSERNLGYMKRFALTYPDFPILQVPLAKFKGRPISQAALAKLANGKDWIEVPLTLVSWYHHISLPTKIKDYADLAFYILETARNGWSRDTMISHINNGYMEAVGKSINNFETTLPDFQSDLAKYAFKDPYNFSFIGTLALQRELDIEKELASKITEFLMEMGRGFAFVGRQYNIVVDGDDYYIDILMYHLHLHCYVVIELKAVEFKPEFVSKLNFYISAVDEYVKTPADNPTIGLLLCRNKSNKKAEFALRGITQPMGIAQYETEKLFNDVASALPRIEDIENSLDDE